MTMSPHFRTGSDYDVVVRPRGVLRLKRSLLSTVCSSSDFVCPSSTCKFGSPSRLTDPHCCKLIKKSSFRSKSLLKCYLYISFIK